MRNILIYLFSSLAFVAANAAYAQVIVACDVTRTADNYSYRYSLTNTGEHAVVSFSLESDLPFFEGLLSVSGVTGWQGVASPASIEWIRDAPTYNIAPGSTLSGLELVSRYGPGEMTFTSFDDAQPEGIPFQGTTTGPVVAEPVPEPTSVGAFAVGGLLYARRRRRLS